MRKRLPDLTGEQLEHGYFEDTWKGYPRFCCVQCEFDTFNLGTIQIHVFEQHQRQALLEQAAREAMENQTRPAEALLYDSGGKRIEEIPVVHRPGESPFNLQGMED